MSADNIASSSELFVDTLAGPSEGQATQWSVQRSLRAREAGDPIGA